jgi:hypothetical protein
LRTRAVKDYFQRDVAHRSVKIAIFNGPQTMQSTLVRGLAALALVPIGGAPTPAQPVCRPTMVFTAPHYSPMTLPKLERTWTLAFSVDASRCATNTGTFSILFTVFKENAPDTEFVDTFRWAPDLNVITKVFWADEAVGAYKVQEIAACPCSDSAK